jgi:hypothetical protein
LHKPAAGRGGGPTYQFDAGVAAKKSEAIDEAHKAAHRTRDAVRQALSAEPYDIDATRKAIAEAEPPISGSIACCRT